MQRTVTHRAAHRAAYRVALYAALGAGLFVLWQQAGRAIAVVLAHPDDFAAYWTAGRVSLLHGNPYSSADLLAVEQLIGSSAQDALMMWNPPWTLGLMIPLSLLPYAVARLLWLGLSTAAVFWAADRCWSLYGGPGRRRWLAWLLALTFYPVLISLRIGQLGPLLLLGVAGFLSLARRGRGMAAGVLLALTAIKPHVVYLVWIALVLWAVDRRRWAVLAGALLAGLVATAAAIAANPQVVGQYLAIDATSTRMPYDWLTPTPGTVLRLAFGPGHTWLQFLPTAAGAAWLVFHWRARRRAWDWTQELPLLVVASAATAPFAWTFDFAVLVLPAILVAARVAYSGQRGAACVWLAAWAALNLSAALVHACGLKDQWQAWLAPVLLVGYLAAARTVAVRPSGSACRPSRSAAVPALPCWPEPTRAAPAGDTLPSLLPPASLAEAETIWLARWGRSSLRRPT